jgi:membrane associated rhomboid family serine protease
MYKRNFIPLYFTIAMWFVFFFERSTGTDLGFLGINPRHLNSLPGILFSPLVHGDWSHLLNNSFSFLVLGLLFFNNYPRISALVFVLIYVLTGMLVWFLARGDVYHIGMSGVIYGLASFIFFSGFYRGNTPAIALSLLTALLYGGMAWGVVPYQPGISWESHLSGAGTGLFLAYLFRNIYAGEDRSHETEEAGESKKGFSDFLDQHPNGS